MAPQQGPDAGVYIVGRFLDSRAGREWTGKDGVTRYPWEVTLLLGRSAVRIEYRTEADAVAALGGVEAGTDVMLRVFVRANKDRAFYSGMAARSSEAAA